MTAGLMEGLALLAFSGLIALIAWTARRLMYKLDGMDLAIRGDGNGNIGIPEKIRDVHQEVTRVHTRIDAVEAIACETRKENREHMVEAEDWKRKIVANEGRLHSIENTCALVQAHKVDPGSKAQFEAEDKA